MPSVWKDKIHISVAVGKLGENSFDFFVMRLFLTVACGLDYKKKYLPIEIKPGVLLLL